MIWSLMEALDQELELLKFSKLLRYLAAPSPGTDLYEYFFIGQKGNNNKIFFSLSFRSDWRTSPLLFTKQLEYTMKLMSMQLFVGVSLVMVLDVMLSRIAINGLP